LQWHTFLGSSGYDFGYGSAVDGSGNVYVTGESWSTWGSPLNPFAGGREAFVARLNPGGVLQWHTFLGSSDADIGYGVAVDKSGNAYVTGESYATWGAPVNPYAGGYDAFVARLGEAVPVPTLSEWGMILLIGLLALYAVWTLRRRDLLRTGGASDA
jgi:hypothetical protein